MRVLAIHLGIKFIETFLHHKFYVNTKYIHFRVIRRSENRLELLIFPYNYPVCCYFPCS